MWALNEIMCMKSLAPHLSIRYYGYNICKTIIEASEMKKKYDPILTVLELTTNDGYRSSCDSEIRKTVMLHKK